MGKKDSVSFSCGFDEKYPRVVAITPFVNDISLTQLISEFEKAQGYEPAGGYSRGRGTTHRSGASQSPPLTNPKSVSWIE